MKKQNMYAMCTNDTGVMMTLERGKEYHVVKIRNYAKFAGCYYVLEDGLAYDSCHFSVTWLR